MSRIRPYSTDSRPESTPASSSKNCSSALRAERPTVTGRRCRCVGIYFCILLAAGGAQVPVARERKLIEAALAESRGRVSGPLGAAAKLGIPSTTLESKIKALKINKHRFKTG